MNDYKKYLLRQMGLKEAQFAAYEQKDEFPGIDPADQMVSPTARPTPIIGIAIRGSSTGGLPSGVDQTAQDLAPNKLGGYQRVSPENLNSKLIDKTPKNPEIGQETTPINDNPSTDNGVTHPHQMQVTAGEEPQETTGASTDSDPTLKLKSAAPKGLDIDIAENGNEEEISANRQTDTIPAATLSETFAKHKKMAMEVVKQHALQTEEKKKKARVCYHCKEPHPCPCDKKDEEDSKLQRNNPEEYRKRFGMKVDKRSDLNEGYSSAFERMRGLAGVGDHQVLGKNGLWENKSHAAGENFNTNWKMDPEKGGMVKIDEDKLKKVKAQLDRKSKRGTLSDKELQLTKKLDEVLKRRGTK